ncbi:class I SAM-dependent methyltransferase [Rhodovibrio salinarum]|uniref:Methyltransferase n=1 Tax=Rhodovibrio salinarum TaxID=1087 RepID=A0A934UZU6_9PROT|nr:50S ribosomal protein L11 methyltransferase [Rhodovibrio salinarum]MBK1696779.1 methyltransferase [Rhodovibrio salinarum]
MNDPLSNAARTPAAFVREQTSLESPRLIPEIAIYGANELNPLWHASEEELAENGVPPPYWAFAWAGGQALARYLLDTPEVVRGKRVLDFAAGSGLCAIAALKAGAAAATASDLDPFACAAMQLNATANDVWLDVTDADMIDAPGNWDVVLAGDVFYEREMAQRVAPWLKRLARGGAAVLVGDPHRHYLPSDGFTRLAHYTVPTTRELEDRELCATSVWRVAG